MILLIFEKSLHLLVGSESVGVSNMVSIDVSDLVAKHHEDAKVASGRMPHLELVQQRHYWRVRIIFFLGS